MKYPPKMTLEQAKEIIDINLIFPKFPKRRGILYMTSKTAEGNMFPITWNR